MTSRQLDEEAIFHIARELTDPTKRETYLDQVCAGDQAFRDRVEALLDVHEKEQRFLKSNRSASSSTIDHIATERPGTMIGRYTLREQIGEGGMGTVFVAEQERPIRRYVALKVIKPGMDSKEVVARFEAERQALALMDHPSIARVLDGGTTPHGRPYFVMELIRGVPISEYCDDNRLTVAERLRLFIQVCKAVQHAHQKGIIHRDIKPSNVLVALHDNSPVPKVIDFGVSKAINQSLTDRTIYTGLHAALGTLAYMAPEQAALTNQDIDTRADVYGLGVLLYELLTGTTPHDPNRLNRAALDEAIRILREEEPPKASTKLSSLGVTATAVSAKRQTDPLGLQRLVRGDLDWILLKALEKDRSRRYETAGALAREIQRLLDHEPVEARPPSTSYRVQKFVRRNKASVTVAVTVFLLTIAGITGTSVGLIRTIRANRALGERNKELGEAYFREALTNVIFGNEAKAGEVIRDARDRELLSDAQIEMLEGQRDLYYGGAGDASDHLRKACELAPGAVLPRAMLVTAFALGKDLGYMQTLEEAEMLASSEKLSVVDKLFLGQARMYRNTESGLPLLREASDEWRSPLGEAILADALTHRANETADISLANQAIRRSQNASAWLTDSAYATTVDLWAHIVFLRLIDPTDPSHGRRASEASKLAQRLEQFPNCIVGQSVRAMYYYEAGDYEAVENMSVSPTPDYIMALVKYRKQDPSMVERLRNGEKQGSNPINQWSLAYTVGFEDSSDAEIHHIYAELHQFRAGYEKWWLPESILLLQHDHEFRRRECKRRLSEVGLSDWERLAVRYIGDDDGVSAEELTMKGAMNGRREEARAHLIIGMKKLLLGATGAEEHLLEASKMKVGIEWYWAEALLDHKHRDPAWPPVPRRD